MTTPGIDDPLPEAVGLVQGALRAGLPLRILGGLGVRVLCPAFPPRLRAGQDMDFACSGKRRKNVVSYLEQAGCQPDRRFNNLNGDRQMYFNAPSGRPIDVMVDRLQMCHTLDLRPSLGNSSLTLDPADLLLSKLQIVELNPKDAHDITHLLSGLGADGLDTRRFGEVLASDWGWWRTVTGNLRKYPSIVQADPRLVPPGAKFDPIAASALLLEVADQVPKSMKWKMRSNIGDRVKWYELPEEVDH